MTYTNNPESAENKNNSRENYDRPKSSSYDRPPRRPYTGSRTGSTRSNFSSTNRGSRDSGFNRNTDRPPRPSISEEVKVLLEQQKKELLEQFKKILEEFKA